MAASVGEVPSRLILRENANFLVEVVNQSANDAVGITLDIAARHGLRLTLENHEEGGLAATLAT